MKILKEGKRATDWNVQVECERCSATLEIGIADVVLDTRARPELDPIPCTAACAWCKKVLNLAVPADIATIYAVQKAQKPVSGSYFDR
jgi:hypothetical protein